jgi:hypothetical protein
MKEFYVLLAFDKNEKVMALQTYKTLKGATKALARYRIEFPEWRHIIEKDCMPSHTAH